MAVSLEEMLEKRPVNEKRVHQYESEMLEQIRAHRLRELRERAGLTQSNLAELIGVSQKQISKIERGNIENAKVITLRKYIEAVGGSLNLEYIEGDQKLLIA